MKYPLLPMQSIEYNVLHALEVGYASASDIETYLRDSGKAVYPRQVSGALQRLKGAGLAAHKNKHERDRWKLVPNVQVQGQAERSEAACSASPGTAGWAAIRDADGIDIDEVNIRRSLMSYDLSAPRVPCSRTLHERAARRLFLWVHLVGRLLRPLQRNREGVLGRH